MKRKQTESREESDMAESELMGIEEEESEDNAMLYRSGSESYNVTAQKVDLSNYYTKEEIKKQLDSHTNKVKDLKQQT